MTIDPHATKRLDLELVVEDSVRTGKRQIVFELPVSAGGAAPLRSSRPRRRASRWRARAPCWRDWGSPRSCCLPGALFLGVPLALYKLRVLRHRSEPRQRDDRPHPPARSPHSAWRCRSRSWRSGGRRRSTCSTTTACATSSTSAGPPPRPERSSTSCRWASVPPELGAHPAGRRRAHRPAQAPGPGRPRACGCRSTSRAARRRSCWSRSTTSAPGSGSRRPSRCTSTATTRRSVPRSRRSATSAPTRSDGRRARGSQGALRMGRRRVTRAVPRQEGGARHPEDRGVDRQDRALKCGSP